MDQLNFEYSENYHQPHLSINSINSINSGISITSGNSIVEPVTPPSHGSSTNSTDIDKDYLLSVNKLPLAQLKPEILKLAKDQYGCRFLQKKIDENLIPNYTIRFNNFEVIFQEIYPNLYELIIDPFGNYLIQKLIKYCSTENLNLMLEILQPNLFQISINQHGTRALQKIIENLNTSYQLNLLVSGLTPFIIELIKDLNGNHVIQKILNKFKPLQCQFIYDSILNDLITVATHKHGCCVLQKCLNHVTNFQLNQFINEILSDYNFNTLINDQFGNYVLQYLISINNYQVHYKFYMNLVKFNLVNYCSLKFSSNVIEKFIKNCFHNEVKGATPLNFINLKLELIFQILSNSATLNKLINDPFGNYVVQTVIDNLINGNVDYYSLKPAKLFLLVNPLPVNNELIRLEIIKGYFQNCKIISSFGRRIHSKVNMILGNAVNTNMQPMVNISGPQTPHHTPNNSISSATSINSLNPLFASSTNDSSTSPVNVPIMNFNSNSGMSVNSRSNSLPHVHSRSNSFQTTTSTSSNNSNYIFDNNFNQTKYPNNFNLNNPNGVYTNIPNSTNSSLSSTLNNYKQPYLKTPQIFSNAPFNDFVDNQNLYR